MENNMKWLLALTEGSADYLCIYILALNKKFEEIDIKI